MITTKKKKDQLNDIFDEMSLVKASSDKIPGIETKVDDLTQKVDAIPTAPPEAPEIVIPSEKLKKDVKDNVSEYFDELPNTSGLLSDKNIRKLGDAFVKSYFGELQEHWDKKYQDEKTQREEYYKKLEAQGILTVDQLAKWAPEFPVEIQRLIRFIGVNIFGIDEPAESVHKVLKIIGYNLLPHCTEATDLEVVAAVQVAEIQRSDIEAEIIVCLISPLCLGNTSSHLLCLPVSAGCDGS